MRLLSSRFVVADRIVTDDHFELIAFAVTAVRVSPSLCMWAIYGADGSLLARGDAPAIETAKAACLLAYEQLRGRKS
jgi:hypothetical protein